MPEATRKPKAIPVALILSVVTGLVALAPAATGSVPPPTTKMECRTSSGSNYWGETRILSNRRYWASHGVWAGQQGPGSGKLLPLKGKRFKVKNGPLRGMVGFWFKPAGDTVKVRFGWTFKEAFTDITCFIP